MCAMVYTLFIRRKLQYKESKDIYLGTEKFRPNHLKIKQNQGYTQRRHAKQQYSSQTLWETKCYLNNQYTNLPHPTSPPHPK